jgi:hypothetical protein
LGLCLLVLALVHFCGGVKILKMQMTHI